MTNMKKLKISLFNLIIFCYHQFIIYLFSPPEPWIPLKILNKTSPGFLPNTNLVEAPFKCN